MKNFQFDQKKIEEICQENGIKLLILHGSYAKGQQKHDSDIDVGILGEEKIDHDAYHRILNDFLDVFGEKFDPAFLNNAEPLICYYTALSGKPLFEKNKGDFAEFKVQSIARYNDTKKFRDLEKFYIKRAVREDK